MRGGGLGFRVHARGWEGTVAQARSTSGLLYLVTTPISRYVATICAVVRVTDQHRCICDVSFYNNGVSCESCPTGYTTQGAGSTSTAECSVCDFGFYRDSQHTQPFTVGVSSEGIIGVPGSGTDGNDPYVAIDLSVGLESISPVKNIQALTGFSNQTSSEYSSTNSYSSPKVSSI